MALDYSLWMVEYFFSVSNKRASVCMEQGRTDSWLWSRSINVLIMFKQAAYTRCFLTIHVCLNVSYGVSINLFFCKIKKKMVYY